MAIKSNTSSPARLGHNQPTLTRKEDESDECGIRRSEALETLIHSPDSGSTPLPPQLNLGPAPIAGGRDSAPCDTPWWDYWDVPRNPCIASSVHRENTQTTQHHCADNSAISPTRGGGYASYGEGSERYAYRNMLSNNLLREDEQWSEPEDRGDRNQMQLDGRHDKRKSSCRKCLAELSSVKEVMLSREIPPPSPHLLRVDNLESTPRRHKKPKNRLDNYSIQSKINSGARRSLGLTVPGMHGEGHLAPQSTPEGENTGCEQQCCSLLGYIGRQTRDARFQPITASRLPGLIGLERILIERGLIVHPVAVLSSELDHYIREVVSSQYFIHLQLSLTNYPRDAN